MAALPSSPASYDVEPPAGRAVALLNDEPVAGEEHDLLGAVRAASQLNKLLLDSRHATPFTLAVDAGWGMGKSSLMRLVDGRLRRERGVHTVWYNAWSSTGADALEGLIKSVLTQVDPNILRRTLRRVREGGALVKAARALSLLAAGPLGVSGMVDELWKSLSVDPAARNGMRDALRDLVGEWTAAAPSGAPGRLLVVFIDDLDRCSEETLLAVCEAVKVYLDVPGLAFVIGCDRAAMGPNGLLRDLGPAGAAFMEKIFQTSYRIPAASASDIKEFVRSCARHAGLDDLLDDRLVELLAYRAAHNPRRIKRLVNGLLLEATLNPIWSDLRIEAVIRTLLLQYLYPDFYRMMTVPAGPGSEDDVVQEFGEYRLVRELLWSDDTWSPATADRVGEFLNGHGLPQPPSEPASRRPVLTTLEGRLPTGFPALADDPAFVTLLGELLALRESDTVLLRLRLGVDGPVEHRGLPGAGGGTRPPRRPSDRDPGADPGAGTDTDPGRTRDGTPDRTPDPAGGRDLVPYASVSTWEPAPGQAQGPYPGPYVDTGAARSGARPAGPQSPVSPELDGDGPPEFGDGYPARPSYYGAPSPQAYGDGVRLPHPVAVAGFAAGEAGQLLGALRARGVEAELVFTGLAWFEALAQAPRAVLCHVNAFGDREEGFRLVRAARQDGLDAPVVFYAPLPTPDDQRVARELGARMITADSEAAVTAVLMALGAAGGTGGAERAG